MASSTATGEKPAHLGVTAPIALNGPTPKELEVTESLLAELTKQGSFESEEEAKLRCVSTTIPFLLTN